MAYEMDGRDITCIAENGLSACQYHWVEISAEHARGVPQVDVCDGASDATFGILQNKPTAGQEAVVRVEGVSRLIAEDTTLAIGAKAGTHSNGHGIAKASAGDYYQAIVISAAAAGGDRATVLLTPVPFKLHA